MHISQDAVALQEQIAKLVSAESTGCILNFLHSLRITPVARFRNEVDRNPFAWETRYKAKDGGLSLVVHHEHFSTNGTRVALALVIIPSMDCNILRLAFHY
jgi:hypothetical protein